MPKLPLKIEADEWKFGSVTALLLNGKRRAFDNASIFGEVAVHPSTLSNGLWAVTHVKIGYTFCNVTSLEDAMKIAEFVWIECRKACLVETVEGFHEVLPLWVRPWMDDVHKKQRWVDPGQYQRVLRK